MAFTVAEGSRWRPDALSSGVTPEIEGKSSARVVQMGSSPDRFEGGKSVPQDIWGDTEADVRDMARLGKKQEFKRNFRMLSTVGFVSIFLSIWEYVLVSLSVGFYDGGFAGLFWCFITTIICYSSIVASLSEMESMAPTSGGQYSWTSEFAPPKYQRILSYASGWMSSLGWLASVSSTVYIVATQIQAIINVLKPQFAFTSWQLTLIMLFTIFITIFFNTWGARVLPQLEIAVLFGHVAGFFIVMIPLLVLCEKNSAYDVFLDFRNDSGYSSTEEVADSSLVVPLAMWWSFVGNVVLGIAMLIAMLFCIGPIGPVLKSGVPYLLLFDRTGSKGLSIFLNVVLLILIFVGNITALATTSRELFAFGRDRGLPFSSLIGRMDSKYNIPFNAVYAAAIVAGVFCLIQLGSPLAFNIIVSLNLLGLLTTYMISIGCVFLKRLKGEPLPPARWSLGRYGIWINGFALFYSAFLIIFSCFPTFVPVTTQSANWAPLAWAAVIILSVVYYVVYGDKHYTSPVDFIEGRKAEGVGLQTST